MWSDDDVVIVMFGDCGRRCGGCVGLHLAYNIFY